MCWNVFIDGVSPNFTFCTRVETELAPLFSNLACTIIDLQEQRQDVDKDIGSYIDENFASPDFRFWPAKTKDDAKVVLIGKADGMYVERALKN
jgi:hypothetical protein